MRTLFLGVRAAAGGTLALGVCGAAAAESVTPSFLVELAEPSVRNPARLGEALVSQPFRPLRAVRSPGAVAVPVHRRRESATLPAGRMLVSAVGPGGREMFCGLATQLLAVCVQDPEANGTFVATAARSPTPRGARSPYEIALDSGAEWRPVTARFEAVPQAERPAGDVKLTFTEYGASMFVAKSLRVEQSLCWPEALAMGGSATSQTSRCGFLSGPGQRELVGRPGAPQRLTLGPFTASVERRAAGEAAVELHTAAPAGPATLRLVESTFVNGNQISTFVLRPLQPVRGAP